MAKQRGAPGYTWHADAAAAWVQRHDRSYCDAIHKRATAGLPVTTQEPWVYDWLDEKVNARQDGTYLISSLLTEFPTPKDADRAANIDAVIRRSICGYLLSGIKGEPQTLRIKVRMRDKKGQLTTTDAVVSRPETMPSLNALAELFGFGSATAPSFQRVWSGVSETDRKKARTEGRTVVKSAVPFLLQIVQKRLEATISFPPISLQGEEVRKFIEEVTVAKWQACLNEWIDQSTSIGRRKK